MDAEEPSERVAVGVADGVAVFVPVGVGVDVDVDVLERLAITEGVPDGRVPVVVGVVVGVGDDDTVEERVGRGVVEAEAELVDELDPEVVADQVAEGLGEARIQLDAVSPRYWFPRSAVASTLVMSAFVDVPPAVGMGIVNSIRCVGASP